MAQERLVVFGDSVPSGQGLALEHKFAHLVQAGLLEAGHSVALDLFAHSGATIGIRGPFGMPSIHREVPVAGPTILEQIRGYSGVPADVRAVVVNGGVNDIRYTGLAQSPDHS